MDIEALRQYCLSKKAVTECFPFDETTLVFKVVDRMFLLVDLEHPDCVSMKCNPDYAIELREHYNGIEGAYHFNKKYWNQVALNSDVPDSLIRDLIDHSYEEVVGKFTKKQRDVFNKISANFQENISIFSEYLPEPVFLHETTSTNSYLDELCNNSSVEELTSVYTDFQTAGRGQRGNSWESEDGANLLFSFVLYPDFLEARKQFYLSQITALALQEVLSQYTDGIRIKWPNDIYWKDKKICGTLIENDLTGIHISRSISGTGVNLNQERFISDAPNPVSLFQITGQRYDRKKILHQLMERVAHYYTLLKNGETELIASRYQDVLYRKEGFYPYTDKDGSFRARICGIEPSGALILEDESGKRREYMFKEVSFEL